MKSCMSFAGLRTIVVYNASGKPAIIAHVAEELADSLLPEKLTEWLDEKLPAIEPDGEPEELECEESAPFPPLQII